MDPLRYFLRIEIARSSKGIILSQQKYILNLLVETKMLGCRPCGSPIDKNDQTCAELSDPIDQRIVGQLIYLCHIIQGIAYVASVVSRYA
jgi:hypothetical protein